MSSHALTHVGVELAKKVAQNPEQALAVTIAAAPVIAPVAVAAGIIIWLSKP